MTRTFFLVFVISVCVAIHPALGEENTPVTYSADSSTAQTVKREGGTGSTWWQKIWGRPARDALYAGMWSIHLDGTGEYFGDGRNNDQEYFVGLQRYGLIAGTFINSHDDRAWIFGPARELYSRPLSENTRFDLGHKFGLLWGYDDDLPNVGGMCVFWEAVFGLTWKRVGIDVGILPTFIVTANFRIDID